MKRTNLIILLGFLPGWVLLGLLIALWSGYFLQGMLSSMFGLSISMFVIAMFSQTGTPKLSPQRAAAIATGHADRETVFEHPATRPLMWFLLAMGYRLSIPRVKRWLRRTIVAAGSPNYYTPEEYLAIAILAGIGAAALLEAFHLLVLGRFSFILVFVAFLAGFFLMIYQLYSKAQERLMIISRRVPYALDLIALAMGAGATFAEAAQTIVAEASDDPLNVELRTMLAEMDLGTTRQRALQNMADRIPLESLRSIIASVIQAEQLGTPLGDVLHDQASLLRLQRSVRAEDRAAVASVRILLPCLLLLMAVILAIFGPMIIRAVNEGLF